MRASSLSAFLPNFSHASPCVRDESANEQVKGCLLSEKSAPDRVFEEYIIGVYPIMVNVSRLNTMLHVIVACKMEAARCRRFRATY